MFVIFSKILLYLDYNFNINIVKDYVNSRSLDYQMLLKEVIFYLCLQQ